MDLYEKMVGVDFFVFINVKIFILVKVGFIVLKLKGVNKFFGESVYRNVFLFFNEKLR